MGTEGAIPIRILTKNIRYAANPQDAGEKPWSVRKQLLLNELHYNTLYNGEAFICLQEVLHTQLLDIMNGLGPDWSYIGVGREDGKQAGEYSPIVYRKGVWQVQNWRTVWLNENGAVGKPGWDASIPRIVTVGTFQHIQSKKTLLALCTHFDHVGTVARKESAKIILNILATSTQAAAGAPKIASFVAGDLNSEAKEPGYQILNSDSSSLRDGRELAKWKYGNNYTYTAFDDKDMELIDFVFLGPRKESPWTVEGYSVLSSKFEDGVYNSDHRPVILDTVLNL